MSPSPVPRESHLQRVPGDFSTAAYWETSVVPRAGPSPTAQSRAAGTQASVAVNYRVRSQAAAAVGVLWAPGRGRSLAPGAHAHARY